MKIYSFWKTYICAMAVIAAVLCLAQCLLFLLDPNLAGETYRLYTLGLCFASVIGGLLIAFLSYVFANKAHLGSKDDREKIKALEAEFTHLEELSGRREEFIASFAHELKTPLTAIIGYADMLRSKDMAPKPRFTAAGYIFSEGKRLEALSLKLMDIIVLGKQDFQKRRYDAGVLIREVAAVTVPSLSDAGMTLEIRWEKGEVEIEPDLFKTLLINLVDNGRKASKHGQSIDLFGKNEEGGYAFYITDYGRGMKENELERITEPFYMVDKSRSRAQNGAGLGLALCKRIAELHGTGLMYSSQPDKGTTVRVFLEGEQPI